MPFNGINNDPIEHKEISGHAFFPAVSSEKFYNEYRIPEELPFELAIEMLRNAVIVIQSHLMVWAKAQIDKGYTTLITVPDELTETVLIVDDENQKQVLYNRAVFCYAKSQILKETITVDRTEDAENMAKTSEETENTYEEYAMAAVGQIQGKSKSGVHLI